MIPQNQEKLRQDAKKKTSISESIGVSIFEKNMKKLANFTFA